MHNPQTNRRAVEVVKALGGYENGGFIAPMHGLLASAAARNISLKE